MSPTWMSRLESGARLVLEFNLDLFQVRDGAICEQLSYLKGSGSLDATDDERRPAGR